MISLMKENKGKALKQKMKEEPEAMQEEVSYEGESSKKDEEDQGKMEQHISTSQSGKRGEDRQENDDCELPWTSKSKRKHKVTREKKRPRKDEGQKIE